MVALVIVGLKCGVCALAEVLKQFQLPLLFQHVRCARLVDW